MSTGGIAIGLVLATITLIAIALPFFQQTRSMTMTEGAELQARYERMLTNIRDLDEDHALGKIDADFYSTERAKYLAQGVTLLRAMDMLTPDDTTTPLRDAVALDEYIETAVAARRQAAES